MDYSTLWLFSTAVFVLVVSPGPANLYVIARTIDQGKMAGLVSVVGMAVGGACHVLAAALGMSALLMTSSMAFNIVKYMGAAYLVYLGFKKLFSSHDSSSAGVANTEQKKLTKIFYQSVLVEVLNPKTALFFLSFLPQFISRTTGSITIQFLVLGTIFIVIALISDGVYALLASRIRKWVVGGLFRKKIQNWVTGGTYIAMGIVASLAKPK